MRPMQQLFVMLVVIAGTLSVQSYNPAEAINVAPLVRVWSWGDHAASYSLIHPDIMTVGKGLGGGMPISATTSSPT